MRQGELEAQATQLDMLQVESMHRPLFPESIVKPEAHKSQVLLLEQLMQLGSTVLQLIQLDPL